MRQSERTRNKKRGRGRSSKTKEENKRKRLVGENEEDLQVPKKKRDVKSLSRKMKKTRVFLMMRLSITNLGLYLRRH